MPLILLAAGTFSQFLSLLIRAIQYCLIQKFGSGYLILDIMSRLYHLGSELSICFLLVLFAIGWGIDFMEIPSDWWYSVSALVMGVRYLWAIGSC